MIITWSPPENEDCIAFYDAIITLDNTTEDSMSASLVAKSRLDFNYSYTAVLPCGSHNATVTLISENICGLRSDAATKTVSEMMCVMNVCPTCGGTKRHDNIIDTLLVLVSCTVLITGLLL